MLKVVSKRVYSGWNIVDMFIVQLDGEPVVAYMYALSNIGHIW